MRANTLLTLALVVVGCRSKLQGTAAAFQPYTAEWTELTGRGAKTPIYWGDIRSDWQTITGSAGSTSVIATCSAYKVGKVWHDKRVVVNADRWFELDDNPCYKLLVITHELVHCEEEQKKHDKSPTYELKDGTQVVNIMSSTLLVGIGCDIESIRQQIRERWRK